MKYRHPEKCADLGLKIKYHHCEHCGKEFKALQNLKQHIESLHSDNPNPKYKCHICSKQLKQGNSFDKHMINAHGVGERCKICNKLFKTSDALNTHMKTVHED